MFSWYSFPPAFDLLKPVGQRKFHYSGKVGLWTLRQVFKWNAIFDKEAKIECEKKGKLQLFLSKDNSRELLKINCCCDD